MRSFYIISFIFIFITDLLQAQVGIGTSSPSPSAKLEVSSTTKGILFPRMSSVQRTSIASPIAGLYVWDTNTKSLWYYDGAVWVNTVSEATYGDVKSGFQMSDHSGWIKLDGRAVNTLTSSQQSIAASFGFISSLPDASGSYLVQNGNSMGAVTGANTVTLTQANLPNVNFTGTASSAGDHTHTTDPGAFSSTSSGSHGHIVDPPYVNTSTNGWHQHSMSFNNDNYDGCCGGNASLEDDTGSWYSRSTDGNGNHSHGVDISAFWSSTDGSHAHTVDVPATTSTTNGAHTHTVSVASGGSATPVNIAPKSLSVNMFVYLGQ